MAGAFNLSAFTSQNNQLKQIPSNLLVYNDDYERYSGEQFTDMVESIKKNGILQPLIVRPNGDGKYTILAGNNRRACGKEAGLEEFPCIVKENLTDEEAQMYIDETNVFQRGFKNLRVSKQAEVIARRHSQMFDEDKLKSIQKEIAAFNGEATDNTSNDDEKASKLEMVGREYDLGKTTIARLIRVNTLADELKPLVDDGSIGIRAAVEISYCSQEEQKEIYDALTRYDCRLEMKKSQQIRGISGSDEFSELLDKIILGTYNEVQDNTPKSDVDNEESLINNEDVPSFNPDVVAGATVDKTDVIGNMGKSENTSYTPKSQSYSQNNDDYEESYDDNDNGDESDKYESNSAKPVTIHLSKALVEEFFAIDSSESNILRTIETALRQYFSSLT